MITHIPLEILNNFALTDIYAHFDHQSKLAIVGTADEKLQASQDLAILRTELARRFGPSLATIKENRIAADLNEAPAEIHTGAYVVFTDEHGVGIRQSAPTI